MADSQTTQDISLVTEGPDRDLLHPALGQAWHQRDVTQSDGWDLLPRTSQCSLTLPVCRICDYCHAEENCNLITKTEMCVCLPSPSPAPNKVFHGFVAMKCPAGERSVRQTAQLPYNVDFSFETTS